MTRMPVCHCVCWQEVKIIIKSQWAGDRNRDNHQKCLRLRCANKLPERWLTCVSCYKQGFSAKPQHSHLPRWHNASQVLLLAGRSRTNANTERKGTWLLVIGALAWLSQRLDFTLVTDVKSEEGEKKFPSTEGLLLGSDVTAESRSPPVTLQRRKTKLCIDL